MAKPIDVHELINTPGAGVAESTLRDAGWWKDDTPDDAPMWKVQIEYSVGFRETLTVQANTEAEARAAAREAIEDNPCSGRSDCVEFYSTTVEPDPYARRADVIAHEED